MDNDLDRPLGQGGERRRSGSRSAHRSVLLAVCAVAVLAASAAISLRERPFRDPPRVVLSSPETAEPDESGRSAGAEALPGDPEGDANRTAQAVPSVIRVDPSSSAGESVITIRDPSQVKQDSRFAHLPDRALIDESELGPLPVRGVDGRRPFDVYARPWSGARGARIAIVVGGLGLSQTGTQEAIAALPPEITLAFAPQGNSLDRWMQSARRQGHEIIVQVPLEPFDYPNLNPGRHTLTVAASAQVNLKDLRWVLSRVTNYTGVMNYMGARFTAEPGPMKVMMAELGKRGLAYLDDGTSARSLARELALKEGVPFISGDAVIDQARERGAILEKLDELERIARARGFAVGTGSAFDVTVETVAAWADEVRRRGIELVPVSAVAMDPEQDG